MLRHWYITILSGLLLTYATEDNASWLIVDSNETPGGLASTDVTPEGFVSYLPILKLT